MLAQDPDWEAFRVLDAESLISFDFEGSDKGSRKEGLRTFAGKVETEGALMTRGSFGDIFSFPIIPHQKDRESLWNLVLTIDQEGNRNWHVREYRGNISDQSVTSMQDFTGSLFIYDMQGALQLEFEAQEGILKKARGRASNARTSQHVDDQGCKYSIESVEVCQEVGGMQRRIDGMIECTMVDFTVFEGCNYTDLNPGTDGGGTGSNGFYTPADQGVPIGHPAPDPYDIPAYYLPVDVLDYTNTNWGGDLVKIPQKIHLSNNHVVVINFGTTKDGKNANQLVAKRLVDGLIFALELCAKSTGIDDIYISATTNGEHGSQSNHFRALAMDISRINGEHIINLGSNDQVKALQESLERFPHIRENFGPHLKNKLNGPFNVGGHADHIHFSVNGN